MLTNKVDRLPSRDNLQKWGLVEDTMAETRQYSDPAIIAMAYSNSANLRNLVDFNEPSNKDILLKLNLLY